MGDTAIRRYVANQGKKMTGDELKRFCKNDGRNGILDVAHIEYRLDVIDSRLDDIAAMLGELFDAVKPEPDNEPE
jgi:hypothetical protein